MSSDVRVEICTEHDPETVLFVAVLPDTPRPGDILGDLVTGTFRVEKRLFLLGKAVDGSRPVTSLRLLCKNVIV
jgi:hypothetical protein